MVEVALDACQCNALCATMFLLLVNTAQREPLQGVIVHTHARAVHLLPVYTSPCPLPELHAMGIRQFLVAGQNAGMNFLHMAITDGLGSGSSFQNSVHHTSNYRRYKTLGLAIPPRDDVHLQPAALLPQGLRNLRNRQYNYASHPSTLHLAVSVLNGKHRDSVVGTHNLHESVALLHLR